MKKQGTKDPKARQSINHDEHEEFLHPNMRESKVEERASARQRRKEFGSCKNCCKRFDELIMKPFLIYNYDRELLAKKDDFLELFNQEADVWEKIYVKEEHKPEDVEDIRKSKM